MLWDVATRQRRYTINGPDETASQLAYSPDGRLLAGGGSDGSAWIWDAANGRPLHSLPVHRWAGVDCLAFTPDGRILATCANDINSHDDHVIRLWDVTTGREVRKLVGHTSDVHALAFSPDGKSLASGSDDGDVRLWDAGTGQLTHRLTSDSGGVEVLRFSGDGHILAAANTDTTVLFWDVSALPKVDAKRP